MQIFANSQIRFKAIKSKGFCFFGQLLSLVIVHSNIFVCISGSLRNDYNFDCSHDIKRHLLLRRIAMSNLDSVLKSRHHFADKGPYSQSYGFSSSYVWM